MVVLEVRLEVLGEVGDALGKERDLHLGRASVRRMLGKLDDYFFLTLRGETHRYSKSFAFFV